MKAILPQADVTVYEQDGKVRGFLGIADGSYIAGLFVAKAHQGQGIGEALLSACKKRLPSLTLDVYTRNRPAISFYSQ
ncbi:GNAT family N-acetyltransferase [Oscillospiraceae bacterium MB08-C2-2]|nr:GNAT family N-acetyltransferase [Oscillospiraceae bacterium MB08-C2-2]